MEKFSMPQNDAFWEKDVRTKKMNPVSSVKVRALGLTKQSAKFVDTIDELRNDPPNIVIAKPVKNFSFVQNYFKKQTLKKKVSYVMGLGVYQQMHKGTHPGQKMKTLKPANIKFRNIYRPYIGQSLEDKTLLVFRTGGIGDLLFIQPNLRYLKEKYPDCTINFACGPQYQAMVDNWNCVDNVVDLPFPLKWLTGADYHALFEGVIERCKEAHSTNAYNLFTRWMGLNLPDKLLIPQQEPKEEKLEECRDILDDWKILNKPFVLTQNRASSPIRTPRPEFWVKIINELTDTGLNVLITDNPRQSDQVEKFINMLKNKDKVFNFAKHSETLDYTIALTKLASLVLATDSALSHIAASLNIKSFGFYGPFPGDIRLKTYPKAKWIDAQKNCAPCFLHGQSPCPKAEKDGFSPCYNELIDTPEKLENIINKIEDHLNG